MQPTTVLSFFLAATATASVLGTSSNTALRLFEERGCTLCGSTASCCGCCQEGVCCSYKECGCP
ncbi:hypothetical protein LZ31DRAFT_553880 [Colletotrichum somersetense]|nr:hypothetical protein LZ31DRAFT_553880 [Colletotrichum somersetense]